MPNYLPFQPRNQVFLECNSKRKFSPTGRSQIQTNLPIRMIKHIASVHARNPPHPTGTFLSHHPAHYAARGMHPGVFREFHQSQGKRASIANRIGDQFLVLCCDSPAQRVGAFNRVYLKRVSHEGLPQLILKWPVRDLRHRARTTPGLINLMHTQLQRFRITHRRVFRPMSISFLKYSLPLTIHSVTNQQMAIGNVVLTADSISSRHRQLPGAMTNGSAT